MQRCGAESAVLVRNPRRICHSLSREPHAALSKRHAPSKQPACVADAEVALLQSLPWCRPGRELLPGVHLAAVQSAASTSARWQRRLSSRRARGARSAAHLVVCLSPAKQAGAFRSAKRFSARPAYMRARNMPLRNTGLSVQLTAKRRVALGAHQLGRDHQSERLYGSLQPAGPARAPAALAQSVSPQPAMARSDGAGSRKKRTSSRAQSARACLVSMPSSSLAGRARFARDACGATQRCDRLGRRAAQRRAQRSAVRLPRTTRAQRAG